MVRRCDGGEIFLARSGPRRTPLPLCI